MTELERWKADLLAKLAAAKSAVLAAAEALAAPPSVRDASGVGTLVSWRESLGVPQEDADDDALRSAAKNLIAPVSRALESLRDAAVSFLTTLETSCQAAAEAGQYGLFNRDSA